MLLMDFPSETEMQAWLDIEPYVIGKVWQKLEIQRCNVRDPWQFNRPKEWFEARRMTANNWNFQYRKATKTLEVEPPAYMDLAVEVAVADFIWAELGHDQLRALDEYRKIWDSVTKESDVGARFVAGNGTVQALEGDEVVLESLYDQWETVRMSRREFENFLSQLANFLENSKEQ
jgi:hypothetical protein